MLAESANGKFQTQTVMIIAEVVETANKIHASYQSFGTARQCASAADKLVQALAKGGIPLCARIGLDTAVYNLV